jgi:hypothetical protein
MVAFWVVAPCSLVEVHQRFKDVFIIRADDETAGTSGTSVYFYQTTLHHNPEDSHLTTRRRENLKFYLFFLFVTVFLHVDVSLTLVDRGVVFSTMFRIIREVLGSVIGRGDRR